MFGMALTVKEHCTWLSAVSTNKNVIHVDTELNFKQRMQTLTHCIVCWYHKLE